MTRDTKHGGAGWEFATCLWSPAHKNPSGRWSHWESLLRVKKGDVVLHLRGKGRRASFVGHSVADADGYKTQNRPPEPGQYAYALSFYRVPLTEFVQFAEPLPLPAVFAQAEAQLLNYFDVNKSKPKRLREHLFYVRQARRLQCFNGGYLSDFSNALAAIVFGRTFSNSSDHPMVQMSTQTREQIIQMKGRVGQAAFSAQVRQNYSCRCCFPGCTIAEDRLLVGSHIARWSDCEHLRGETSNGLCLCLMHDKAFELGLYTVTKDFRVAINQTRVAHSQWGKENLVEADGLPIMLGTVSPSVEALEQHWVRIAFAPGHTNDSYRLR